MTIRISHANEHNLQDVSLELAPGLTVVTGISGSGKTSLVFDTMYHEARRRFQEIYAPAAPGERLAPAQVESISGLGPAVAVGQNLLNRNPLSTLATASGLHPFLRLLYANFGERRCARCDASLLVLTPDEIVEKLGALAQPGEQRISAPLVRRSFGSHRTLLASLSELVGSDQLLVDGRPYDGQALAPAQAHDIEVLLLTLSKSTPAAEIRRAVQAAEALGVQALAARRPAGESVLARAPVCLNCGAWFGPLDPVHFHQPCPYCQGEDEKRLSCSHCSHTGLHPAAAAVRWRGLRLPELLALPVDGAAELFQAAGLPASAGRLLGEIARRLEALQSVGLGYLTLDRPAPTLSRGEAQRVRLAVALTSRLEDMLHVLDEPTIGQHPADVARLLPPFRRLAGPVVYVEHDRQAVAIADRAIDLGPGAGRAGGRLLFAGPPAELWQADTPSGRFFSQRLQVQPPSLRPPPTGFLTLRGAYLRNLKGIDISIPLARLTVVVGVSGSGKSTLVEDVLVASLQARQPIGCRAVEGPPLKPVLVDQSPIGLNPRSNPATYTGLADTIRDLFAAASGLSPAHFSFNRPEGACPTCGGMGAIEVQMRYLPSTWIPCTDCAGQRFSEEVLAVRLACGREAYSIADFYNLSVAEAEPLLATAGELPRAARQAAARILAALQEVGLGYLPLGQPSPTLSGGEAQRIKLAKYLGRAALAGQLLVLDEPSTGLHPHDIRGLLTVLDRLARAGASILVVEHNLDLIRAADWIIELGPGAGPAGGQLVYAGPQAGLAEAAASPTGQALRAEAALQPGSRAVEPAQARSASIQVRRASAHNLKSISVAFPKGALTVVTGVSGSGKSSLVSDVLEAEARRRYLETLSLYERQSTREGPQAPVEAVTGLGVAVSISPERSVYRRRATVGSATELSHHLAVLLARIGQRRCLACGAPMQPASAGEISRAVEKYSPEGPSRAGWCCPVCRAEAPPVEPRHFSPSIYAAACQTCHGVGSLQQPQPAKLIIRPEEPLLNGAMYSPGFFPKGYLGKPFNGGYDLLQALAARHQFDPFTTPWNAMTPAAQQAFLFGDPEPMPVTFVSRSGRSRTIEQGFPGFYGFIRDWDVGGTYTDTVACPACGGAGLRPEYLAVTLDELNAHQLNRLPLVALLEHLEQFGGQAPEAATARLAPPAFLPRRARSADPLEYSLAVLRRRLRFLIQVGLGYLHLDRPTGTLSAGEAQRVKLAGLLGSQLTNLTVLLDEPSRGLHPCEVSALKEALLALRDQGNTVIVIEHDPLLIRAADHLIEMGPGSGTAGGQVVAQGPPGELARADTPTTHWLNAPYRPPERPSRQPHGWLSLIGAGANNLRIERVDFPLGLLTGVCGLSGSGKSTLLIDTLGRALAPKKQTTSVAYEPVEPGAHQAILGAPSRAILVDQGRAGITSPADFLALSGPLQALYAASADAQALGLTEAALGRACTACGGRGALKVDLGFLPPVYTPCDTCRGTGYPPEAWEIHLHGLALPEISGLTIEEVWDLFGDEPALARPLAAARQVGLGYLVLRQPGHALSGGEAQRLKIARELSRKTASETLYILDEPTIGQHLADVARLVGVLGGLVEARHTVLVAEHHPHLLAACDWLVELGPGGGPEGGLVIASGPPPALAQGATPMAPYLRQLLGAA